MYSGFKRCCCPYKPFQISIKCKHIHEYFSKKMYNNTKHSVKKSNTLLESTHEFSKKWIIIPVTLQKIKCFTWKYRLNIVEEDSKC